MKIDNRSLKRSNKLDRIGVQRIKTFPLLTIPFTTPSPIFQWKLHCRSRKQKRKNQPITTLGIERCAFNVGVISGMGVHVLLPITLRFWLRLRQSLRKTSLKQARSQKSRARSTVPQFENESWCKNGVVLIQRRRQLGSGPFCFMAAGYWLHVFLLLLSIMLPVDRDLNWAKELARRENMARTKGGQKNNKIYKVIVGRHNLSGFFSFSMDSMTSKFRIGPSISR